MQVVSAYDGARYRIRWRDATVDHTAPTGSTAAGIAEALSLLMAAYGSVSYTDGATSFTWTSNIPGRPVTLIPEVLDAVDVAQTVRLTTGPAATGGTWSATFDWGAGNETAAGLAHTITDAALKTAIEALATPQPGDITVVKVSAYQWDVTIGGTLIGTNATVSVDTSALTGGNTITIDTIRPGGAAGTTDPLFLMRSMSATSAYTIKVRPTANDPYQETATLYWYDSMATVLAALEALDYINRG